MLPFVGSREFLRIASRRNFQVAVPTERRQAKSGSLRVLILDQPFRWALPR
jgi:hypothetical protein